MKLDDVVDKIISSAKLRLDDWLEFENAFIEFSGTVDGSLMAENILSETLKALLDGNSIDKVNAILNCQLLMIGLQIEFEDFVTEVAQKCKMELEALKYIMIMNIAGMSPNEIYASIKPQLLPVSEVGLSSKKSQHREVVFDYIYLQAEIEPNDQERLNAFAKKEMGNPSRYEKVKWSLLYRDKSEASWYSVLDEDGLPLDIPHIIEDENRQLILLDRENAYMQWFGEDEIIVDNGRTYLSVDSLSTDDINILAKSILAYQLDGFLPREFAAAAKRIQSELEGVNNMEKMRKGIRAWLHLVCIQYSMS